MKEAFTVMMRASCTLSNLTLSPTVCWRLSPSPALSSLWVLYPFSWRESVGYHFCKAKPIKFIALCSLDNNLLVASLLNGLQELGKVLMYYMKKEKSNFILMMQNKQVEQKYFIYFVSTFRSLQERLIWSTARRFTLTLTSTSTSLHSTRSWAPTCLELLLASHWPTLPSSLLDAQGLISWLYVHPKPAWDTCTGSTALASFRTSLSPGKRKTSQCYTCANDAN